jgi:hypothetical protein
VAHHDLLDVLLVSVWVNLAVYSDLASLISETILFLIGGISTRPGKIIYKQENAELELCININ